MPIPVVRGFSYGSIEFEKFDYYEKFGEREPQPFEDAIASESPAIAAVTLVFESPDPVDPCSMAIRTFPECLENPLLPKILFCLLLISGILCQFYQVHPSCHPMIGI